MGEGFVLLTYSAASNKIRDENRKAWPPKVTFDNSLGVEMSKVT